MNIKTICDLIDSRKEELFSLLGAIWKIAIMLLPNGKVQRMLTG